MVIWSLLAVVNESVKSAQLTAVERVQVNAVPLPFLRTVATPVPTVAEAFLVTTRRLRTVPARMGIPAKLVVFPQAALVNWKGKKLDPLPLITVPVQPLIRMLPAPPHVQAVPFEVATCPDPPAAHGVAGAQSVQ
jgi:hypothetical protein